MHRRRKSPDSPQHPLPLTDEAVHGLLSVMEKKKPKLNVHKKKGKKAKKTEGEQAASRRYLSRLLPETSTLVYYTMKGERGKRGSRDRANQATGTQGKWKFGKTMGHSTMILCAACSQLFPLRTCVEQTLLKMKTHTKREGVIVKKGGAAGGGVGVGGGGGGG